MDIKPFKIKYYLEKKDPDFESKMHDVLLAYKQIEIQFDENGDIIIPDDGHMTHTISYDENPESRQLPTNIPIITQRQKMVLCAGITNMSVWERFHCLPELTC